METNDKKFAAMVRKLIVVISNNLKLAREGKKVRSTKQFAADTVFSMDIITENMEGKLMDRDMFIALTHMRAVCSALANGLLTTPSNKELDTHILNFIEKEWNAMVDMVEQPQQECDTCDSKNECKISDIKDAIEGEKVWPGSKHVH